MVAKLRCKRLEVVWLRLSGPRSREVGESGVEVKEAIDVGVGVACLPQVGQGCADVVDVIAVCAPARKNVHEGIAGGGVPLGSYAQSSVLEDGTGPGEASLRRELLGVVDKLLLPPPVS